MNCVLLCLHVCTYMHVLVCVLHVFACTCVYVLVCTCVHALTGEVHRVMSLRNPLQKMSKSDNQEMSSINLSDSSDTIMKKIRRAVTDCMGRVTYDVEERPGVSNLIAIYAAMSGISHQQVCADFEGKQTVDFKTSLGELLVESLSPIRERMEQLEGDPGYVDLVLREGAEQAKRIAEENLVQIREKMGIL